MDHYPLAQMGLGTEGGSDYGPVPSGVTGPQRAPGVSSLGVETSPAPSSHFLLLVFPFEEGVRRQWSPRSLVPACGDIGVQHGLVPGGPPSRWW